jgi:phage portal protein BeeE
VSVLFRRAQEEQRASIVDIWSRGDRPASANSMNEALRVVPVYAATSLIADQLAAAPWSLYDSGNVPR